MKMHLLPLLPLASFVTAIVIPDQKLFSTLDIDSKWRAEKVDTVHRPAANPLDAALDKGSVDYQVFERVRQRTEELLVRMGIKSDKDSKSQSSDVHDSHKHRSELTIYQLISESKYTTKLAKLVSEDDDLVKVLNGTKANYTLFAPTDSAFEKIPDCGKKPSKEFIRELLLLHISDDEYSAKKVLASHTIPTLHEEKKLGGRQRLAVKLGLKGLTINYFSRIVAVNIFGKNGVIHGIDHIIFFPPPILPIIEATPGAFSTLALGLSRTGLDEALKDAPHVGSTWFAPSNRAFAKLGPRVNAFLFSKHGRKYLKALLEYHVVHNETVYSDAYYHSDEDDKDEKYGANGHDGYYHLDLPTLLKDRSLPVDIARWGPFINIRVNGYVDVSYQDGAARDGAIQVVSNVLIPPKKVNDAHSGAVAEFDYWDGVSEITELELIERLEPYVKDCHHGDDADSSEEELVDILSGHDKAEKEPEPEDPFSGWSTEL